ncbi:MAG: transcriptional regulator [Thermoplasmata archaeon]|nr:MAG: transcriptional regulator [Thermoplasmata archaeon]
MRDKEEALALETRRKIYEVIEGNPGLHFRELMRRVNVSHSTLKYHISYLIKKGLVTMVSDGGLTRYYAAGKVDRRDKVVISALRNDIERRIVMHLLSTHGSNFHEIMKDLNMGQSKLSYHLKRLVEKKIVDFKREGKSTYYYIIDEDHVISVLIKYRPSFLDALVDSFVKAWLGER